MLHFIIPVALPQKHAASFRGFLYVFFRVKMKTAWTLGFPLLHADEDQQPLINKRKINGAKCHWFIWFIFTFSFFSAVIFFHLESSISSREFFPPQYSSVSLFLTLFNVIFHMICSPSYFFKWFECFFFFFKWFSFTWFFLFFYFPPNYFDMNQLHPIHSFSHFF